MSSISSLTDSDQSLKPRSNNELLEDKKPSPSEKPSSSNTAGVGAQEPNDTEVEIIDGATIVKQIDPIAKATLQDVKLSATRVYFIKLNAKNKKKAPPFTDNNSSKVEKILDTPAVQLKVQHLRIMCRRHGLLRKVRNASKAVCLQALAYAKVNPPKDLFPKKKPPKPNKLNAKRFCNALFCESIRPKLSTRGQGLTKDELTAGLKTDQLLHESICKVYNDTSADNAVAIELFTHLKDYGSESPDVFHGPIIWTQSKEALKNLLNDYDKCFHNWKKSGNHGGLGDRLPFADFSQSSATLVYLHEFVYQYPNIFEKVTGELPSGAFSESMSSKKKSSTVSVASSATKKRRPDNNEALAEFNRNSAAKNKAIQYNMLMQSYHKSVANEAKQQDRKRNLFKSAMEESSQVDKKTRKSMKNRYKAYKSLRETMKDDGDSFNSDDSIGFADSQASKFQLILQCERNAAKYKEEMKYIESELNKTKKNKENVD